MALRKIPPPEVAIRSGPLKKSQAVHSVDAVQINVQIEDYIEVWH